MTSSSGLKPIHIEESHIRKSAARWFFVGMILFGIWAAYAPIDAGISVPGTVVVFGNRKAVQHPRGGVVQTILTSEGATVKQGDILVKVNPLNSEADYTGAELQYINLLATESRLLAERSGQNSIAWKPELKRAGDARVLEAKLIQTRFFQSRLEDQRGQQNILTEQVTGLQAQVEGLQGLLKSQQSQLEILTVEAKDNRQLAEEGFVPRSRANEVGRSLSALSGNISGTSAELAKTRAAIAATRLQLLQQRTNYLKEIDGQLSETQKSREGLQSRVESLRFDLSLAELRAPVSGTVVNVKVNTVGGVIQAGQTLMEIVPAGEHLVIEAKVPPNLIDKVRVGLDADMRFSAFNVSTTPVIPGRVKVIGADKIKAEGGGAEEYYLAQIEVSAEGKKLLGSLALQPGMPVDVIVKTGERSFFSYFVKPITDRFARAMKEQ
jgi:protease secretion system membrane fusion protein